jgi:hypothetical protein
LVTFPRQALEKKIETRVQKAGRSALLVNMLVLFETAMGYCLFKVTDTNKIESADLWKEFESPEKANKLYVVF